jgi:hypothetical protein
MTHRFLIGGTYKMKKRLAPLAAIAALVASPAFAATIIQTHDFATTSTTSLTAPVSTVFGFNQFDASLGTLNSVTLSFNAKVDSAGTLGNTANSTKTITLSKSAAAALAGGGFNLDATLLSGSAQYNLLGKFDPNYHPASITLGGVGSDSDTLSSGLSAFLGSGLINFTFSGDPSFGVTSPGALDLASSFWGDATLTYDYTAATPQGAPIGGVPEPAMWSMMILGFATLGGALRRRRAKIAAATVA